MISSKDISASQRLKCSLDIFFLLGILLRNSVVATMDVCLLSEAVVRRCCIKKVFLKILQISQENTCARTSFFNKVSSLSPTTLFKKRLQHKCFPMKFRNFLRTSLFIEHLRWLLLMMQNFFINFFGDLRISLGLLKYFDLLSSVYNSNIVSLWIFCLSRL